MDFSSVPRALQSLQRRKPSVSPQVLHLVTQLLKFHLATAASDEKKDDTQSNSNDETTDYKDLVLELMQQKDDKNRWEPLAVGLHLAVHHLEDMVKEVEQEEKDAKQQQVYVDGPRVPSITIESSSPTSNTSVAKTPTSSFSSEENTIHFCEALLRTCRTHLQHSEPRVRTLVAKAVGSHARYAIVIHSTSSTKLSQTLQTQRQSIHSTILSSLQDNIKLGREEENKNLSRDSTGAMDDTTGWRSLETNLQTLASYANGCASVYIVEQEFEKREWNEFLKVLEFCANKHVNRHVRAASIATLEVLIHCCEEGGLVRQMLFDEDGDEDDDDDSNEEEEEEESVFRETIVEVLKVCLADNWSQVRMAASVLCRKFFMVLMKEEEAQENKKKGVVKKTEEDNDDDDEEEETTMEALYPILLPRMCLNRFYLAQGVKLYSHETWRLIFEKSGNGLEMVAKNAASVCRYYVKMCDADNHVVREAGCQAVAELAQKIGTHDDYAELLAPFVPMLLQALIMCFHDESWPVRDEACLACGTFCKSYPEECIPELSTLFSRWTEQLTDQIWSVREDAAVALGDAIDAYGTEMLQKVLAVVHEKLPSAKDQPAMTKEEYKRRQNDIESHTNSQLYSCGSLAPKLRKGGAGRIGCSDCAITRPKSPWEATDGCIYLLRELCLRATPPSPTTMTTPSASNSEHSASIAAALTDETLVPLLTDLADVCRVKHFPQGDDLRTTLWKQLPIIANALGKKRFKRHYLQLFLDLLMSNLDDRYGSPSQLSVHAAGQCMEELANLVGKSIFRGRLEEMWQEEAFDRVLRERANMGGGGPMGSASDGGNVGYGGAMRGDAGFSPFGPPGMFPAANGGGGGGHDGMMPGPVNGRPATTAHPTVPGSGFMDEL